MRKNACLVIVALFIISLTTPAFSADDKLPNADNQLTKLGRGLANIITFPLEIPNNISKTNNSDGPFAGWTVGVLKGLWWAGARAVVGVYETVSFPVPAPKDYQPILKDPEYFLEDSNF